MACNELFVPLGPFALEKAVKPLPLPEGLPRRYLSLPTMTSRYKLPTAHRAKSGVPLVDLLMANGHATGCYQTKPPRLYFCDK